MASICSGVSCNQVSRWDSPVSVVEPLDEPGAIGQSDLNVGERLGGVQGDRGAGCSLVSALVL